MKQNLAKFILLAAMTTSFLLPAETILAAENQIVEIRRKGNLKIYDSAGKPAGKISQAQLQLPLDIFSRNGVFLEVELGGKRVFLKKSGLKLKHGPKFDDIICSQVATGPDTSQPGTRLAGSKC